MVGKVDVAIELDVQIAPSLGSTVALGPLLIDARKACEERSGWQVNLRLCPGAIRATGRPHLKEAVPVWIYPRWEKIGTFCGGRIFILVAVNYTLRVGVERHYGWKFC